MLCISLLLVPLYASFSHSTYPICKSDQQNDSNCKFYTLSRMATSWELPLGESAPTVTLYLGTSGICNISDEKSNEASYCYICNTESGYFAHFEGQTSEGRCTCQSMTLTSESGTIPERFHATAGQWKCESSTPSFFATECETDYTFFKASGLCVSLLTS